MKNTIILAIETSCDDTSIAILCNYQVLANVTLSTVNQHKKYGGIVPEVASRGHEKNLLPALQLALKQAKIKLTQLTHIAYTFEPGLPGSLHVGKVFAKSLAFLLKIPLIPTNHMNGHIFSFAIGSKEKIVHPFISLIVSGGHTSIYLVKNINNIKVLNTSTDDAIGETLDKVGRMLNLPYPGGISIDKMYSSKKTIFPMIKHNLANMPFSFSGIKTHILNHLNQMRMKNKKIDKVSIASSLLKWVIDDVIIKIKHYLQQYPLVKMVTIGGGVSANQLLRREIKKLPLKVLMPQQKYTNDNAAMIGYDATLRLFNTRN